MGQKTWKKGTNPKNIQQIPKGIHELGKYRNLMAQINKIAAHNNQGSYKTRERYHQAVDRFCRHLADQYRLQKFANIADKHLISYVQKMQNESKSASTVKTDLCAIRQYHDQISNPRNRLSDNENLQNRYGLELEKRHFGGVDRSWKDREFQIFLEKAVECSRPDIKNIAALGRYAGLRIHECTRLDRAAAERGLRTGQLHVKGKGGLLRDVPLRAEAKAALAEAMRRVDRGEKLFVPEDRKTHQVIKDIQNFITRNRDEIQQTRHEADISFHGLRHTYAREEYQARIDQGIEEKVARLAVSELMGHHREEITKIYTGE